jgi:hypothetical protein
MRVAAFLVLLAACGGATPQPERPHGEVYLTLDTLEGQINFSSLRGKVVVAHFGTTWSLAAQADQAELGRAAAGGAAVVEIMLDPDHRLVRTWAAAARLSWPIALASADVIDGKTAFGKVSLVPATFVLDRGGRIVWERAGPLPLGALAPVVVEASRAPP